jgi:hypothetical protein
MSNPEIRVVKNKDIDFQKWDQCIENSLNSRVYAYSWYLDIICPDWHGLIWGDYEYVMPLIFRRKLGMTFLLQPIFAQQHGIFPIAPFEIQTVFLNYIRNQFSYIAIQLNAFHSLPFPEEFDVIVRKNLILRLNPGYDELKSQYSKHAQRQLRKAENMKVSVIKGLQPIEYIRLKNQATDNQLSQKPMQILLRLIEYGYRTGKGTIYAAYSETNTLCAAAFFLNSGSYTIYLNAASNDEGKQNSSMYRIVDSFIHENSGSSLTLDFEGSSIPGVARFYEGFGAASEQYYSLKLNHLPIPFRWIKK